MYNSQNQVLQQNAQYGRYQAVGLVDPSAVSPNNMPVANRSVAAPMTSSQRQADWGLNFTGGDKKTLEMAEHVKMKALPFYEIKRSIIKQRCLVPNRVLPAGTGTKQMRLEAQIDFGLTFEDCNLIAGSKELYRSTNKIDYGYQLQLRFGVLNTNGDQDDEFPPSMNLRLNSRPVPLPAPIPSNYPGTPPRQPSKPLNVTSQAKLRPVGLPGLANPNNSIVVSWLQDIMNRNYVVSLNLVKKLNSDDLFKKLKAKGNMEPTVTKKMIESMMKVDEDGLAPAALKVSVACPVGKSRMVYPCRSTACSHIQCFDASLYLQMNEKKPVWSCPVCNKKILYDEITIDGYFVDIINELAAQSVTDIEINADGSWNPIEDKDDSASEESRVKTVNANDSGDVEMMSVDDDGEKKISPAGKRNGGSAPKDSQPAPKHIEVVSLSDSDDDSPPAPPPKPIQKVNPIPAAASSGQLQTQSINPVPRAPITPAPSRPPPPVDDDDDDVILLSD